MNVFVALRLAIFLAAISFGAVLPRLGTSPTDLVSIAVGMNFFLASVAFLVAWKPTVTFFTTHPVDFARFVALAMSLWTASIMLASIWAVRWKASGYSPAYDDSGLLFASLYLAICGSLSAIAAPSFFEISPADARRRLGWVGLGLACIVLTVLVMVYGGRLEGQFLHDDAPTVGEAHP